MFQDTLLNVFLAIAVDNLTNAEILTSDEDEQQELLERQRSARRGLSAPGNHWSKAKAMSFVRNLQKQVEENEVKENDEMQGSSKDSGIQGSALQNPGTPLTAKLSPKAVSPRSPHISPRLGLERLKQIVTQTNGNVGE